MYHHETKYGDYCEIYGDLCNEKCSSCLIAEKETDRLDIAHAKRVLYNTFYHETWIGKQIVKFVDWLNDKLGGAE